MTAPSVTHMSRTEYDALTTAIRHGGTVMRCQQFKVTTLLALEKRDWVTLTCILGRVVSADITAAGRHAAARFAKEHGHGVDPRPFQPSASQVDPFALMGPDPIGDLLDELIPA
jgi:hypothetical protein